MTSEFWKRVAFTLGALLVFRTGTYIPIPGIDAETWSRFFPAGQGGLLGIFNTSSGGAIGRLSILALGILPYVSASIIVQFASFFVRGLRTLRDSGDRGRRKIETYTRAVTFLMAAFQGYGLAVALSGIDDLVSEPGPMFLLSTALTLAAGAMFLVWLAAQITLRGIGNGIALLVTTGIIIELPQAIAGMPDLRARGLFSDQQIAGIGALAVLLVVLVALMEKARRDVPVVFAMPGAEGDQSRACLSFKLNGAGTIPSLLAAWFLAAPLTVIAYLNAADPGAWVQVQRAFQEGRPLYMICEALLIIVGVYFYTAMVLDPAKSAESLRRYGGAVPSIAPGEATAQHIDYVASRVTLLGAVYFAVICLVPQLLLYKANVPFYLGGPSLLILVCTVLDIEKQVRAFSTGTLGG